MKKLYFLNEDEKHRILNLHEGATKKQYLTEAINRNELPDKISKICTDKPYGVGNFTEGQVTKNAELMKRNLPLSGGYKSDEGLKVISDNIKSLGHIDNYCRVMKKYKEIGGKTVSGSLLKWINAYVYNDSAWELYIKQAFEALITKSETEKNKMTDSEKKKEESDQYYAGLADKAMGKTSASGGEIPKMGRVLPSVEPQIQTLLAQAGIQGKELDQTTINKLYDKLSKK
jgi:hypothetical protein